MVVSEKTLPQARVSLPSEITQELLVLVRSEFADPVYGVGVRSSSNTLRTRLDCKKTYDIVRLRLEPY